MTDLKLELSSNKFRSDIINSFENLHTNKDFTDVTLVSEDGDIITAHKVVLGACSQFFKQVFLEMPHKHPLLFLKGIKKSDLEAILEFVYLGRTKVAQIDLGHFMESANALKIKGLHENTENTENTESNTDICEERDREERSEANDPSLIFTQNIEEKKNCPIKKDSNEEVVENILVTVPDNLALEVTDTPKAQQKPKYTSNADSKFPCDECDYLANYKWHLKRHKQGMHGGKKFECDKCGVLFSFKTNLHTHKQSKHEGKMYSCQDCVYEADIPSKLSYHKRNVHNKLENE